MKLHENNIILPPFKTKRPFHKTSQHIHSRAASVVHGWFSAGTGVDYGCLAVQPCGRDGYGHRVGSELAELGASDRNRGQMWEVE